MTFETAVKWSFLVCGVSIAGALVVNMLACAYDTFRDRRKNSDLFNHILKLEERIGEICARLDDMERENT